MNCFFLLLLLCVWNRKNELSELTFLPGDASLAVGVIRPGAGAGGFIEDQISGARDVLGLPTGAGNHDVTDALVGVLEDAVPPAAVTNRPGRLCFIDKSSDGVTCTVSNRTIVTH